MMKAGSQENNLENVGGVTVSSPPPDVKQPVEVVPPASVHSSKQMGPPSGPYRLSDPPDDMVHGVEAIEPSTPIEKASAFGVERYRVSLPPGEVVQGVEVVTRSPTEVLEVSTANPMNPEEAFLIIREVAKLHSGKEFYSHVGTDRDGLTFGMLRFSQASGLLGDVLEAAHKRDPEVFDEIFGPDARELRQRLTAKEAEERLRPVGGKSLLDSSWRSRFRQAAVWLPCQYAQNEVAMEKMFRPMLALLSPLSEIEGNLLAAAFELVVDKGLDGAKAIESLGRSSESGAKRVDVLLLAASDEESRQRLEFLSRHQELGKFIYRLSGASDHSSASL